MTGYTYHHASRLDRIQIIGTDLVNAYDATGNLLAEANGSGVITRYYIYGKGRAAMVTADGQLYMYHFDGTGHTVAMTNSAKQVVNRYAYSPYGEVLGNEELVPQPFTYAGQVGIFTEADNLYYMRARYYDAKAGRFISEDPAGFVDGPNLYAYVGGNPVGVVDPSGQFLTTATGVVSGAVGGATGAAAQGQGAMDIVMAGFAGGFVGGIVGTVAPPLAAVAGRGAGIAINGLIGFGANTAAQIHHIALSPNLQPNDFSLPSAAASGLIAGGSAAFIQGQLAQNVANVAGNTIYAAVKDPIYESFLQPQRSSSNQPQGSSSK